jgi:anti-sigma-K factor RskA
MIDDRRESQASLYALGALPPDEVPEFEVALSRDLELQMIVRELRGTAALLPAAFPQVAPPPALKGKIMASIEAREGAGFIVPLEPSRTPGWLAWMPWAMAACFAVLCVALISLGHALRRQAVTLSEELHHNEQESAALKKQVGQLQVQLKTQATNYQQRVVTIEKETVRRLEEFSRQSASLTNQLGQQQFESRRQMANLQKQVDQLTGDKQALTEALTAGIAGGGDRLTSARISVLRPTASGAPNALAASVWSAQDQRGVLVVEGLPALPASQAYQLWILDSKVAAPVSAGVLPANATGALRVQFSAAVRVDFPERFAISIEPNGGVTSPTGKIVMASN